MNPLIGIFDLDGTLGYKTPSYPNITPSNGSFLRHFSSLPHTSSIIATGRPRTQARLGLEKGGIRKKEIYQIFSGGIFEDGLFVEDQDSEIYNALNQVPSQFKEIKKLLFSRQAKEFLQENGFLLFPGFIVKQTIFPGGKIGYDLLDYNEHFISSIKISGKKILYEQGNDVRGTYKAPIGYMNNDLEKQKPLFEQLEPLVIELIKKQQPDFEKYATLVRWEDAVEIYPVLGKETFRKGVGLELILEKIDPNRDAVLLFCCDGKNDISLVNHFGQTYGQNHLIILPSNASSVLKEKINQHNLMYGQKAYILKNDCTNLGDGVLRLLKELNFLSS